MYRILATNSQEVKEKGLDGKNSEISVAIKDEEFKNGIDKLYAYRWGMIYDPENDFSPNIKGNQKIKLDMQEEFFKLLPEARKELYKLKSDMHSSNANNDNSSELVKLKDTLNSQKDIISALDEIKNKQESEINKLLKELKEAKNSGEKGKIVHEKFNTILDLLKEKQAVYCYGQAGTGKSEMAKQLAEALNLKFYPMSTLTQEFKLHGFVDGNGKYHETNFYRAFKNGGLFFLDEMDSCVSDVLVGINGALANGYYDFPEETIYAHENFRVMSAGNTIGRGGNMEYTGRFALDMSTLDRFWGIEIDYSPEIDKAVSNNDKELVEFARALRKASKETEISILMSYRSISRIAKFQDKFKLSEIMDMAVTKGMAKDDIQMLSKNIKLPTTNKYFKAFKELA